MVIAWFAGKTIIHLHAILFYVELKTAIAVMAEDGAPVTIEAYEYH